MSWKWFAKKTNKNDGHCCKWGATTLASSLCKRSEYMKRSMKTSTMTPSPPHHHRHHHHHQLCFFITIITLCCLVYHSCSYHLHHLHHRLYKPAQHHHYNNSPGWLIPYVNYHQITAEAGRWSSTAMFTCLPHSTHSCGNSIFYTHTNESNCNYHEPGGKYHINRQLK